ncbi:Diphosphomevalonate decarboxylase [uncultured archaeon]|nr:Diphosphomevalonate decarboxylase [uncultured archaeon]
MEDEIFTAVGRPNIAFIKYWGKRDGKLNLPFNSSLSLTLGGKGSPIITITSVMFTDKIRDDVFYIDGKKEIPKGGVVEMLRSLAGTSKKIFMVSQDSFPKSAGLASSASGSATLACAASNALGLKLSDRELSIAARFGSGSASRSVFGGIVEWHRGDAKDGSDSYAEQIADENFWPELVDVIGIVSGEKKKVSSDEGHLRTPRTSQFFASRPAIAEESLRRILPVIKAKDFNAMAEIIMRDSNSMHASMLDSWPSINYLNDRALSVMSEVERINRETGENVAAYTFDAGPNPHIITTRGRRNEIRDLLARSGCTDVFDSAPGRGPVEVTDVSLIGSGMTPGELTKSELEEIARRYV